MIKRFVARERALECYHRGERLLLEPWGPNAIRVRASRASEIPEPRISALVAPEPAPAPRIQIDERCATIDNGLIRAEASIVHLPGGDPSSDLRVRFINTRSGEEMLSETRSHWQGPAPRYWKGLASETWRLETTFAAREGERFYGMGQQQHGLLDLKGAVIELQQRNSHVSVPFVLSSLGYGLLWNNPAVGRVEFARNHTRWTAEATRVLDYCVVAGEAPADVLNRYAGVTGRAPMMPYWASGFWQCRLRYKNQDELLSVAREFKKRRLPLSCIVIDFFHWTRQGDWRFDPDAWPDPRAMVRELNDMGVRVMVSVWPSVAPTSENMPALDRVNGLITSERGTSGMLPFLDRDPLIPMTIHYYDATNPQARALHWDCLAANYVRHGIVDFWVDACEPEIAPTHPENLRFHAGNGLEVANAYPTEHTRGLREGLSSIPEGEDAVLLCRSTWAGGQRFGALLWSGDIASNWEALNTQVRAGLQAAMSGIGWWTCDIGGFYGGQTSSPEFRELLIRWFQYGVMLPVTRLHGFRVPDEAPLAPLCDLSSYGDIPARLFVPGGGRNEPWVFGEDAYAHIERCLALREALRPYVMEQMKAFSEQGRPPMRPLFVDFPDDANAWQVDDSYMFGPDLLVHPITRAKQEIARIYLPAGAAWRGVSRTEPFEGGTHISVETPLTHIPVFVRVGSPKEQELVRMLSVWAKTDASGA